MCVRVGALPSCCHALIGVLAWCPPGLLAVLACCAPGLLSPWLAVTLAVLACCPPGLLSPHALLAVPFVAMLCLLCWLACCDGCLCAALFGSFRHHRVNTSYFLEKNIFILMAIIIRALNCFFRYQRTLNVFHIYIYIYIYYIIYYII
jgi:hypothetical protein